MVMNIKLGLETLESLQFICYDVIHDHHLIKTDINQNGSASMLLHILNISDKFPGTIQTLKYFKCKIIDLESKDAL